MLCTSSAAFMGVTGEDEHNTPVRKSNTLFPMFTQSFQRRSFKMQKNRLFRPKPPQRLTNHQRYGTSCLEEETVPSFVCIF